MARMLTEEEVRRLEDQRAQSQAASKGYIKPELLAVNQRLRYKTSRELTRERKQLEAAQKRPDYDEGLTDEDKRAIRMMDAHKIERLNREATLERQIEAKEKEEVKKGLAAVTTEDLVEAYDDEEGTPFNWRESIRDELKKRGLETKDYDLYRWTDTGVERRKARINELQKEFDTVQEEQQKWAGLSVSDKRAKMRKRYSRWAEQQQSRLDEIEKELNELRGLKATK